MAHHVEFDEDDAIALVEEYKHLEGPLLPILHAFSHRYGYIGDEAVRLIAGELNLTRAEVYGVVSFYHDFKREPHGRHVLKVCRAEACQAAGGDAIADSLEKALGIKFGETSADGAVTLEAVYCLGLCATAPSAMLDDRIIGRLNQPRAKKLAAEALL
ncbi:formate dehydrogenase, gamma subunit protein [Fulvimarina pelagi HTCC2506]|uniref:Formate dehydrogenase, gamma subunit protein n=1 Tax=Fulvimarina pelagi HTCC2506 TaxID=314231 RepID=Q0G5F5_9HYPH|nr:formate dehydrogenase subunit gamma [Fulvimarina pelagi]EAU43109.1 formate dehydrogenase, gamma subunit protein [Fulvimarina pelagi HTCC2506]